MSKPLSPTYLAAALFILAGCQSSPSNTPKDQVDPQAFKAFTVDMQHALQLSIATAVTGEQVGAVTLQVTLDRNSAPTACKARVEPFKYGSKLPANVQPSDHKALAALVEGLCWKTIYPVVPAALFKGEASVDMRAPIVVELPGSVQAPGSARLKANAQREFFWQQLFRDQPVDSIGRASLYYEANAQGKVQGCLVQIYPHPNRPDDFRLDGQLQAELNRRCMTLDLISLPGFKADTDGVAKGYSEMEYAPWKVGRQ